MNRILVTGLALGAEPEIGLCSACNYDMNWLFRNPSTLLWADKIILTPKVAEAIHKGWGSASKARFGEAVRAIFEGIEEYGLIEIRNPADIVTPSVRDDIVAHVENDCRRLLEMFPSTIMKGNENVPGSIMIEGTEYCTPALWSVYASLLIASEWKTNVFYPPRSYTYLKYKFGLNSAQLVNQSEELETFKNVFSATLPEKGIIPNVLYDPRCKQCKNEIECDASAIRNISKSTKALLAWRDYDEIQQLRDVFGRITSDTQEGLLSAEEILDKYHEVEAQTRRKVRSLFPKIERWSNVITIMSLPVIVAGVSTGSTTVASIGAAVAGLATLSEKYTKLLQSKYKWLGFMTQD